MASTYNRIISTRDAPAATGPYSQAVFVNNVLYVSGQYGLIPGKTDPIGGAGAETKQAMTNINGILQAAGGSFKNVFFVTIVLANMNDFTEINDVYNTFFPDGVFPARTIYQVRGLPKAARVEIKVTAFIEMASGLATC